MIATWTYTDEGNIRSLKRRLRNAAILDNQEEACVEAVRALVAYVGDTEVIAIMTMIARWDD